MRSAAGALRRREAEEGSSRPALRGADTRRVVVVQRRSSLSIGEASAESSAQIPTLGGEEVPPATRGERNCRKRALLWQKRHDSLSIHVPISIFDWTRCAGGGAFV